MTTDLTPPAISPARRRLRRIGLLTAAIVAVLVTLPVAANAIIDVFAAHDHGTIDVVINGQLLNLDQPRYHELHPTFHIHPGDGNRWHHHPRHLFALREFETLTVAEALAAVDLPTTSTQIEIDGTVYDGTDPNTTVRILVNGEIRDPEQVHISDHMAIRVDVLTRS